MYYPKEFKTKVKLLYPNSSHMHKMLEEGNELLGNFLDEGASNYVDVKIILEAKSLRQLQKIAKIQQQRSELYNEWLWIYRHQK